MRFSAGIVAVRHAGFTLVEVMVALAVVAIALPALMVALNQQIDGTGYLRDKSMAHMVAANKLTEIRILAEASRVLPVGKDSGAVEMAGRDWHWWQNSEEMPDAPGFHRIEVKVADNEDKVDEPLIMLVIFLSSDLQVDALANAGVVAP